MREILLATAMGALTFSTAHAEDLKIFNWGQYFGPTTLEDFEKETGINVIYDTYDSLETLETRIFAGGSGFDVVFASGPSLQRIISADLVKPLDKTMLDNLGNLDPKVVTRLDTYDPGAAHSVPYMWGTIGIGYNPEKVAIVLPDADMSDLATIFDPANAEKLAECGLAVIDSPNEVLGIALNYLGEDPYTGDKKAIAKAEDLITAIRPSIRYFDSVKPIDDLATGEICVALMYSGDAGISGLTALEAKNGIEVSYAIPNQGTLVWADSMFILKDAENSEAAYKFIDYILRPEVIADATNYVFYANANAASIDLVLPEISGDPNIYPSPKVMDSLFAEQPLSNKEQRLRTRIWTRIKTGN